MKSFIIVTLCCVACTRIELTNIGIVSDSYVINTPASYLPSAISSRLGVMFAHQPIHLLEVHVHLKLTYCVTHPTKAATLIAYNYCEVTLSHGVWDVVYSSA